MSFRGILEYGTDAPTAFYAVDANMDAARAAPIDGTVISVFTDSGVQLSVNTFTGVAYTMNDLSNALADMSAANCYGWGKLRYRFIKTHCSSQSGAFIDPFDPAFDTVIANYKLLGRFAALTGCGVNFDGEAYTAGLWTYDDQPLKGSYAIEEYQARWYEIGYELGTYWLEQDPNMLVFIFLGYEVAANSNQPPATNPSWLYNWFLNGLHDAYAPSFDSQGVIRPKHLISTAEVSYACTTSSCIDNAINQVTGAAGRTYRGQSQYFGTFVDEFGLALWIDRAPFNPATPELNYFTPAVFRDRLLDIARELPWAWIYDPDYAFYNVTTPRPIGLIPQAYLDEINYVRRRLDLPIGDEY